MITYIHFFRANGHLMINHGIIADTKGAYYSTDGVWQTQTGSNVATHRYLDTEEDQVHRREQSREEPELPFI